MCTGRLRRRVPSAKAVSLAPLPAHRLRFHKRSSDGSGKADAEYTGNQVDVVWGVIFEIDASEKGRLSDAEGLEQGYKEKSIELKGCDGRDYTTWLYFASDSHKGPSLRPYGWYLRFVTEGAKQHHLPAHYIALLEQVDSMDDQDRDRDARRRSVCCQ